MTIREKANELISELDELETKLQDLRILCGNLGKERDEARELARELFNRGRPSIYRTRQSYLKAHPWLEEK